MVANEPEPAQPKPRFAIRFPTGWRAGLSAGAMVIALLLAYLVYLFGLPDLYFWRSPGRIYVESPEIYTRERLVNDRYLQAAWLNNKLDSVEKSTFSRTRISSSLKVGIGAADAEDGKNETAAAAADSADASKAEAASPTPAKAGPVDDFPYDIDFDLKSAMRDKIRQDIIENMLDDRHDLTGNSLVAMKFDTTVLKRRGSSYHARVALKVTAEKLFSPPNAADGSPMSVEEALVKTFYFSEEGNTILTNEAHPLYRSYLQYNEWLKNLEHRLNRELDRSCKRLLGSPNAQILHLNLAVVNLANVRAMFRETLAKVLSIQSDFEFPETDLAAVPLPTPWSDVISLQYSSSIIQETNCSALRMRVLPLTATIFSLAASNPEEFQALIGRLNELQSNFATILVNDEERRAYFTTKIKTASATDPIPPLVYGLAAQIYETLATESKSSIYHLADAGKLCLPSSTSLSKEPEKRDDAETAIAGIGDYCDQTDIFPKTGTLSSIFFPAGYFAFMKKVERSDSYLYSLIPNGSSTARVLSKSASLRLGLKGGEGRLGSMLDHGEDISAFDTEPEVLTFGMGSPADVIEFGWIAIGNDRTAGPETFSQTALLSVPAWANQIEAEVTTGWVDDSGSVVFEDPPRRFPIPMPSDYEIFDTLISDGMTYRRPNIDDDAFGTGHLLRAGQPGSIIIPGVRLWRSTVVTLGSQKADEIFVLPDMEGVIASFKSVGAYFDDFIDCKMIVRTTIEAGQSLATLTGMPPQVTNEATAQRCTKTLPLRVWTSEGMDEIDGRVTVVDILSKDPAAAEGSKLDAVTTQATRSETVAQ